MWTKSGVGTGRIAALGLSALLLTGCSMGGLAGQSAFGNAKVASAEIPAIGSADKTTTVAQARAHFRNADYGYSAAYYKRLIEMEPKNHEGYVGLGASYDRLGRFDLSDRVYATLYTLKGASAQYYNNVGYSYLLRGNLTGALQNFRKAQKLDPENMVISNNILMLSQAAQA
jgi:Flp pilus assembly protein TadD